MGADAYRARRRARVAPRSRGRGGSKSRIRWDRLGRIVLVLVLFAVLASYVNPLVNFIDSWRDSRAEQGRLEQVKAENERLSSRAKLLRTDAAVVREARKLGMVAPGERPYLVRDLDR